MQPVRKYLSFQVQLVQFLPEYIQAIAGQWTNLLFGETVLAVIFLIWWAIGSPPLILIFVSAALLAAYYAWQSCYVRLIPSLFVTQVHITPTPTTSPESLVMIQIELECLTQSPVNECQGHLLRVLKKSNDTEPWKSTAMDESLELPRSIHDNAQPFTLLPGVPVRLNLCMILESGRIQLVGDRVPLRWAEVFNGTDIFKFDVSVTAKDCSTAEASVTVKMGSSHGANA